MSLSVDMGWEIRTTGAATNGGGFIDSNPGTSVDYSQQDAAQLALSDIATDGAGTGVSSTTGGFTAAMEGNCIYIAGAGFTTGWYQITGYTDTNTITIDRSAGASQSGGTGNVGGAYLPNQTDATLFLNTTNKAQYAKLHWAAGTYTGFNSTVSVVQSYQKWVGYKTTRGDTPIGNDRPFIDLGTSPGYIYWSGSQGNIFNIRIQNDSTTSSPSQTFYTNTSGHVQANCKIVRTGNSQYACRFGGDYSQVIQCEYQSALGTALEWGDASFAASFCYIHDSNYGATYTTSGAVGGLFSHCIFDTIAVNALKLYFGSKVVNCTFYNITGIAVSEISFYTHVVNSIFHTCGTAINGNKSNLSDHNVFYNNTTNFNNGILPGDSDLFTDPMLADPANQDFTLAASSPCFDAGLKLGVAQVGLS